MQITVTGKHVEVSEDVKKYALEKADRLPRFFDRIQSIEVIFGHEADQFSVEILVNAGVRNTFVACERGADTFALIDLTVDKLERQLTKHKEKLRNRMHVNRRRPPPPEAS